MRIHNISKLLKRNCDVFFSISLLIVLSPLLTLVAIAIRASSPGPALFIQSRPGKNGRLFNIYKFRTMFVGSEKMERGKEVSGEDPRITRIGRLLRRSKIDELPQLINVVKGEMSLVGPRPERISSLSLYNDEIAKRLEMLPGMTGLAQVSGNIHISLAERYKLDCYYVRNYSILLDLKIIIRTIGVVIYGEDKYMSKRLVKGI